MNERLYECMPFMPHASRFLFLIMLLVSCFLFFSMSSRVLLVVMMSDLRRPPVVSVLCVIHASMHSYWFPFFSSRRADGSSMFFLSLISSCFEFLREKGKVDSQLNWGEGGA